MKLLTLLLILPFLGACAFTYPGKEGNITVEFTPTHEMLQAAGLKVNTRTLRDK